MYITVLNFPILNINKLEISCNILQLILNSFRVTFTITHFTNSILITSQLHVI